MPSIKFSGTSAGKVWLLTDDQKFLLTITEPAGRRPRKEHLVKVPARYPADQTEALSFLGHSESVQTIIDKGNHNA